MSNQVNSTSSTLSEGWARTVRAILDCPGGRAFHTVTVMTDPTREDDEIRTGLDRLLERKGRAPVVEVANTVFPQALAATSRDVGHLGERYRAIYPRVRALHRDNKSGTYFGRLVEYPSPSGPVDQLATVVARMKAQRALVSEGRTKGVMSAAYEATVHEPHDPVAYLATQLPGKDRKIRGFPCMTGLSFQLIGAHLHLLAQYRYEYMFTKGYGNYLGLAQLMTFVASQVGANPGQLTVVTGRAQIDLADRDIRPIVDGFNLNA